MHAPIESKPNNPSPVSSAIKPRSVRILARTIFRDMKEYGMSNEKIVEMASELIGLVAEDIEDHQ